MASPQPFGFVLFVALRTPEGHDIVALDILFDIRAIDAIFVHEVASAG
jgi:hypothetical protein